MGKVNRVEPVGRFRGDLISGGMRPSYDDITRNVSILTGQSSSQYDTRSSESHPKFVSSRSGSYESVVESSPRSAHATMELSNISSGSLSNDQASSDSVPSSPADFDTISANGKQSGRQDSKVCGVCGDKALGNNFNAITCESCKAFFRRNALKTKEFVCPFNNNCKVDAVTRRFCQKCRLKKCFDIGMKKEWIMTDEEKKIKKIKIEQNRLKRQSGDSPACDEIPVTKAACMVTTPKTHQIDSTAAPLHSPPDPTLPHKVFQEAIVPSTRGEESSSKHQFMSVVKTLDRMSSEAASDSSQDRSFNEVKYGGEDLESSPKLETPLLNSLIKPGMIESPLDVESSSESYSSESNLQNFLGKNGTLVDSSDTTTSIQPPPEDGLSDESQLNALNNSYCDSWSSGLPLPLNTMDSIVSVAINAEFSSFGSLNCRSIVSSVSSHARGLNKAEQSKLDELLVASQALNAPVDAEGLVKVSDQSLINVINLTDIAIRRLIKMSKKISAFKNMCQEDQIALLKGGCTEMMILRSVVSYDPDRDSWKIPHSKLGYNINLGVLKEARGNLYEEHQRFLKSFRPEWRSDENIMMLLCSITLFTPERPNVIHRDVVKLEQDSYYYLLKRYLESVLGGCEARSAYLKLIKIIAELRVLNSNHLKVFLALNPREVAPLLIEIFDLK